MPEMSGKPIKAILGYFLVLSFVLAPAYADEKYHSREFTMTLGNSKPVTFTVEDFEAMAQVFLSGIRLYTGTSDFIGVPLKDLIQEAGFARKLTLLRKFIFVVRGLDGNFALFSCGEIFNRRDGNSVVIAFKSRSSGSDQAFRYIKPRSGGIFLLIAPNDRVIDKRTVRWVSEINIFSGKPRYNGDKNG